MALLAPSMMPDAQQPLSAAPAMPVFTDLTPLEQRLRLQQQIMGGNINSSPTSWAGGLARLIGALGSAWAAKRTQDTINSSKTTNAKAEAAALKGVLPDSAMPFLASMDPSQVAPFAIEAIQKKQQNDAIADALGFAAAPAQTNSSAPAAFNDWYSKYLLPQEGTEYTADDGNGSPARYGINQKADGVDVSKITPDQAKAITYGYWQKSGADQLPPALAAIQADTAFNMGQGAAARLLQESGGDPQKYLALREARYKAIAQANPAMAKFLPGWMNRNSALAAYAGQLGSVSSSPTAPMVAEAAPQTGAMAKTAALLKAGVPLETALSLAKSTQTPVLWTADANGNVAEFPGLHFIPGTTGTTEISGSGVVPKIIQAGPAPKNPVAANPGQSFYDPTSGKITTPVKSDYDRLYGDGADSDKKSDVQRRMYDMSAWSYLQTGKLPALGFKNNDARQTIMERAGDLAQKVGLDPSDVASLQAGFGASAAGLKKIGQYSSMMQGFQSALDKNADLALSLMSKGAGTMGSPVFNRWQRFAKGQYGGDPDVVALNNAILTVNNAYAKISSGSIGSSGSTDASRTAAANALSADMTPAQMQKAIAVMKQEATNEIGGFTATQQNVMGGMKNPFTGTQQKLPTGMGSTATQPSIDDLLKKYGVQNGH